MLGDVAMVSVGDRTGIMQYRSSDHLPWRHSKANTGGKAAGLGYELDLNFIESHPDRDWIAVGG